MRGYYVTQRTRRRKSAKTPLSALRFCLAPVIVSKRLHVNRRRSTIIRGSSDLPAVGRLRLFFLLVMSTKRAKKLTCLSIRKSSLRRRQWKTPVKRYCFVRLLRVASNMQKYEIDSSHGVIDRFYSLRLHWL